jgi:hypothetical protein
VDKDRATALGLTLTAIGTTAAMVDRVLPPMHEVRNERPSPETTAQIRSEFARTAAVVVTIGAGVSSLTRSLVPLAGVLATAGWLWWEYERAAANDPGAKGWR